MTKESQLIAERAAIDRLHVAGEVPPLGSELIMREMVPGQSYLITRQGQGPSLVISTLRPSTSQERKNSRDGETYFHASILTTSMIFRREA